MVKRRSRETALKNYGEDKLAVPFNIDLIGTDNDPCFGKLYDMTTNECQQCGDSEFCALAMMKNLKSRRDKLEKKQNFKDIDSKEVEEKVLEKTGYARFIKDLVRLLTKRGGKASLEYLATKATQKLKYNPETYQKYLRTAIEDGSIITKVKNNIKLK